MGKIDPMKVATMALLIVVAQRFVLPLLVPVIAPLLGSKR